MVYWPLCEAVTDLAFALVIPRGATADRARRLRPFSGLFTEARRLGYPRAARARNRWPAPSSFPSFCYARWSRRGRLLSVSNQSSPEETRQLRTEKNWHRSARGKGQALRITSKQKVTQQRGSGHVRQQHLAGHRHAQQHAQHRPLGRSQHSSR